MTQEKIIPSVTFNKRLLNIGLYHIIDAAPAYDNTGAIGYKSVLQPKGSRVAVNHANQYIEDVLLAHFEPLLPGDNDVKIIIGRISQQWDSRTNYTAHIQPIISMLERHIIITHTDTDANPDDTERRQHVAYLAEIREILSLARLLLDPIFAVTESKRLSPREYRNHFKNPPAFTLK